MASRKRPNARTVEPGSPLGERIKALVLAAGAESLDAFERGAGLSVGTLSRAIRAERDADKMQVRSAIKLARSVGVDCEAIFSEEGPLDALSPIAAASALARRAGVTDEAVRLVASRSDLDEEKKTTAEWLMDILSADARIRLRRAQQGRRGQKPDP